MQREILIYNTLTQRKEAFVPRTPGEVSIYVCGVTPYDDAHLGHARPSVVFDMVRRFLKHLGYRVRFVQNFTDVDDKIIDRANREGVPPLELAATYSQRYLDSMDKLRVQRADLYPKVSEHIDDIIAMIEGLIQKGAAYESGGSVFFRVEAFADYGKLSKQRKEELIAGARIEPGEGKESPLDFALWKAAKPNEPSWPSPWGPGRPGWHIECSAMSLKYLGSGFDIHGGGLDLVFPHHENEVAQSEAYTGEKPFVRYWMHNGLIQFDGEKMSKSLGNFVTVDDLVERHGAAVIRYLILMQHYRSPMNYSDEQVEQARKGCERLNRAVRRLAALGPSLPVDEAKEMGADPRLLQRAEEAEEKFLASLADDFNSPAALGALFELVRDVRAALDQAERGAAPEEKRLALAAVLGVFERLAGEILGVLADEDELEEQGGGNDELVAQLIRIILEVREEARKERAFARADRLRDRLGELGIVVEDSPEGPKWAFKR